MANLPSIPPLVCSTPPPIEFVENDDDSGLSPTLTLEDEEDVFGEYTSPNEGGLTPEVSSLPRTPLQNELSSSTTSGFTDDQLNLTVKAEINVENIVEACNYFIDTEHKSNVPKETQGNGNLSPANDIKQLEELVNVVKLEDISDDDSENELHSLREIIPYNETFDLNSTDFFAIHAVDKDKKETKETDFTAEKEQHKKEKIHYIISNENENDVNNHINSNNEYNDDDDDDDDFAEFATFERADTDAVESIKPDLTVSPKIAISDKNINFEADFSAFDITENIPNANLLAKIAENSTTITEDFETENAEFDDFQDFSTANDDTVTTTKSENSENLNIAENQSHDVDDLALDVDDDDDDEFGDFTVATVPADNHFTTTTTPQPAINLNNLHERLKCVLEMMFPTISASADVDNDLECNKIPTLENLKTNTSLQLSSIDAAKALDYQWTGSEMRHALIKSIGIDSRNILYGEKWNPAMPRYAANLSCNPLQPLKPQSTSGSTVLNSNENSLQTVTGKKSNEVPAVDFDWNSSGLVNPLDGSKEILQPREIETHTTASSTNSNTNNNNNSSNNNDDGGNVGNDESIEQKQLSQEQQQQPAEMPFESFIHNIDTTTTTSTAVSTTTTTTLSPIISTDSLSLSVQPDNNEQIITAVIAIKESTVEDLQNEDEVITTSTYAGPLKETHIYTPSRGGEGTLPRTVRAGYGTSPTTTPINSNNIVRVVVDPIDFDYEKAAAGIIIDETVVKKEYRDVEYNPDFSANDHNKTTTTMNSVDICDDDFTEFQSVPVAAVTTTTISKALLPNSPALQAKQQQFMNTSRTATPTFADEMILSPAVLLPQAVNLNNNNNNNNNNININSKPKIEWGEMVGNINPEELARIEELFPQTKMHKTNVNEGTAATTTTTIANNSNKATPIHSSALTISATIAQMEQNGADDDDWSEFVSVTVPKNISLTTTTIQNTFLKTKQTQQQQQNINTNNNNDDDWSDFVSSTPAPSRPVSVMPMVQFNSGAWQNANFYNNPLSFYQPTQPQQVPSTQKLHNNNNNININNNNHLNNYVKNYNQQNNNNNNNKNNDFLPQKIHIMQDFSTAPPSMQHYTRQQLQQTIQTNVNNVNNNNQFHQLGSAKVAPSISLIPDLGFVAPAMPSHTTYVNTLPKSTFNMKK